MNDGIPEKLKPGQYVWALDRPYRVKKICKTPDDERWYGLTIHRSKIHIYRTGPNACDAYARVKSIDRMATMREWRAYWTSTDE